MDGCYEADDARFFQMAFIIMAIFTRVTNYLTWKTLQTHQSLTTATQPPAR